MNENKRSWPDWPVWIAMLFCLVVIYAGAYLVSVRKSESWYMSLPPQLQSVECHYAYWNSASKRLFAPAHWMDTKLRRKYWHSDPIPIIGR